MKAILAIPLEVRLAVLALVGLVAAGLVNACVDVLAFRPRGHSPWSRLHPRDGRHRWLDRLPLLGWWRLRRQATLLGRGFWVRPLLVELACAWFFAFLYHWELAELRLIELAPELQLTQRAWTSLHWIYLAHLVLFLFMLTASLIDLDEMAIPDTVTVTGTLAFLLWVSVVPRACLPARTTLNTFGLDLETLTLNSPEVWNPLWDGLAGLAAGLACYLGWCLALLPRLWRTRRGLGKAVQLFVAHAWRSHEARWLVKIAPLGVGWLLLVWGLGAEKWHGLLSSLVGLAAGGGMVWAVRLVAGWALGREAMGFGDVTLMAMIGSLLGWQAMPIVFFLAPFAGGMVTGLVRLILRRGSEIPYGPFLCLAALGVILGWKACWFWMLPFFELGWLLPLSLVVCLLILAILLRLIRLFTRVVLRHET